MPERNISYTVYTSNKIFKQLFINIQMSERRTYMNNNKVVFEYIRLNLRSKRTPRCKRHSFLRLLVESFYLRLSTQFKKINIKNEYNSGFNIILTKLLFISPIDFQII